MNNVTLIKLFEAAKNENHKLAAEAIFSLNKKSTEKLLYYIAHKYPSFFKANINNIVMHGGYKSLFKYINTPCKPSIIQYLADNIIQENVNACKFLPQKGSVFDEVRDALRFTSEQLRKLVLEVVKAAEKHDVKYKKSSNSFHKITTILKNIQINLPKTLNKVDARTPYINVNNLLRRNSGVFYKKSNKDIKPILANNLIGDNICHQ